MELLVPFTLDDLLKYSILNRTTGWDPYSSGL